MIVLRLFAWKIKMAGITILAALIWTSHLPYSGYLPEKLFCLFSLGHNTVDIIQHAYSVLLHPFDELIPMAALDAIVFLSFSSKLIVVLSQSPLDLLPA